MSVICKRILPVMVLTTCIVLTALSLAPEVSADESMQNLLSSGKCGLYVRPIEEDVPIAMQNPELPLTPASITKAVTAASVMSLRDSLACFITPVWMCGDLKTSPSGKMTLDGDIVICPVGDPTLGDDRFKRSTLLPDSVAAALKRLGIDSVAGQVRVDGVAFVDESVPEGWGQGDLTAYYGAPLLGSTFAHNMKGGQRGRVNMRPDTTLVAAVRRVLRKSGISLGNKKGMPSDGPQTALYLHRSPTYKEIMRSMMVRSDNLYAEGMLRTLAEGDTRANALSEEMDFLSDPDLDLAVGNIRLKDGSGLSRANRITPHVMANLLAWMAKSSVGTAYIGLFPVVGKEGTVRGLLKGTPLEGKMVLKSGTMTGIKCYAGYKLDDKTGRPTHVVVAMVNEAKDSRRARADIEKALLKIFVPTQIDTLPDKDATPDAVPGNTPVVSVTEEEVIEELF